MHKRKSTNLLRKGGPDKRATSAGSARTGRPRVDVFLHLSRVLTAHELDELLARQYSQRVRKAVGPQFDSLLDRFEALVEVGRDPMRVVRDDILPHPTLGPVARTILLLWYTGGIQAAAGGDWEMQNAEQYYRALVWEAIGAHPPTLSNGYFGHWKYPPEM